MELLRRRAVDRPHSNRSPNDWTIAFGVWTVQPLKLDEDGPRDPVPVARVPASQEPAHQPASPRRHPTSLPCVYRLERVRSAACRIHMRPAGLPVVVRGAPLLLLQRRNLSLKRGVLDEETIVRMARTEDAGKGRGSSGGMASRGRPPDSRLGRAQPRFEGGRPCAVEARACPPEALGSQVKILL